MLSEMLSRFRLHFFIAVLASMVSQPLMAEPDTGLAAIGKHIFRTYCASCHGQQARGDGPVAEHLLIEPSDLTQISARHDGKFPAERVFKIIDGREKVRGHGNSEMPIWGDAFRNTDAKLSEKEVRQKITALVHFLESIQVL